MRIPVMMLHLILLISVYHAGRGNYIDDPEPEVTWTPPTDQMDFKRYTAGANYSGQLYAGIVEFNWVVDIRTDDGTQEDWAIGNLVSYYHVLTTCRAITKLQRLGGGGRPVYESAYNWTAEVYRESGFTAIRIYYCQHYLWEGNRVMPKDSDSKTSGSRSVRKIIRHPQCVYQDLIYDAAIIVMDPGIPAIEPRIGYMPTGFDYVKEKTIVDIKLDPDKKIDHTSPVCFVASFGRNYVNHQEFYVLDYKTKIRVYITPWKDCGDAWKYICRENGQECPVSRIKEDGGPTRYCFRARAKVGNVCDRDRGAPVVCNGVVIGMVIRGADSIYCNNLYKIPFVAESLDRYPAYFDKTIAYDVKPVPMKVQGQGTSKEPLNGASAHEATVLLYLACWATLSSAIK